MAIAISANGEDQPASALSPTGINAQRVEGGGASSVQMGQENVIALLLQQQEEVLREIRDQKKVRRTCASMIKTRGNQWVTVVHLFPRHRVLTSHSRFGTRHCTILQSLRIDSERSSRICAVKYGSRL